MKKTSSESAHTRLSPRIAHVDFYVNKEEAFLKYVNYLSSPFHIMWRNFLAGTFHGVGFILGTSLFLAIVGWILKSVLGEVPFFSDFSQAVGLWLESTLQNKP